MKGIVVFALMLMAVAAENEPKGTKVKRCVPKKDILSGTSCRYLKTHGYLDKNPNWRKLCLKTYNSASSCTKSKALGMESKAIPENRITASSAWPKYEAKYARLNHKPGGWGPKQNSDKEWLQVDLGNEHLVTAIATQGSATSLQWMKTYTIQYSLDGSNFIAYQSGKVFTGNNDRHTVVKHDFKPPIVAQYIRVVPKTWYSWVVVRMELYGCKRV